MTEEIAGFTENRICQCRESGTKLLVLPAGSGAALGFGVRQATHFRSEDLFWIIHTLQSQAPAGFRNLAIRGSTGVKKRKFSFKNQWDN